MPGKGGQERDNINSSASSLQKRFTEAHLPLPTCSLGKSLQKDVTHSMFLQVKPLFYSHLSGRAFSRIYKCLKGAKESVAPN